MTSEQDNPWWRGAVIYQVWPRSFFDSNGDGIGDLPGITAKLDYIRALGVDGLWISPFFRSPMKDYGYDVADHCDVDPGFGTLADFDRLLARAHALGLRVVIDQVYSHTSDRHAWFAESRASRDNPRADWYVWADAKPDGSPPNNWLSVFGGPAWSWDARRQQYYLHNYLASQPDLNLHNPAVQDAVIGIARFWLARGVDGLRFDALNYGMHDTALRDNPPAPAGERPATRPWSMQVKRYNTNRPELPAFIARLRRAIDDHGPVLTVAEVGGDGAVPVMRDYTRGDDRLSTAYGFDFLNAPAPDAARFRRVLSAWPQAAAAGWPSWAFSNHDAPRVVSRWALDCAPERRARLFALLLASLRGNAFVYQGEELGLPQADLPFENLRDPEAIANWPATLGRDGARTPLPWRADARAFGFTTGTPWLEPDPAHRALAVDRQTGEPGSVLNFFRAVLALRRDSPALRLGGLEWLDAPDTLIAFRRRLGDARVYCVCNPGNEALAWQPPDEPALRLVAGVGTDAPGAPPPATLDACSAYLAVPPAGPRPLSVPAGAAS